MTPDTDAALSYLREQFGEGWTIGVREARHMLPPYWSWSAVARHRGVTVEVIKHPDPMSAARACVEAARDAGIESAAERDLQDALSKRMSDLLTRTANAMKGEPKPLHLHDWSDLPDVAKAERDHADRLAEALREAIGVAEDDLGWEWSHDGGSVRLRALLAAHDARRSGGEGVA